MHRTIQFDDIDKYGPQEAEATFRFSEGEVDRDEIERLGDVHIQVRVEKGPERGEYDLTGKADFTGELACSRCLDPFPFAHESSFTLRYVPRPAGMTDEESEFAAEESELDIDYYTERVVDLRPLAEEQVHLAVPMKPLCEEACLGLCPQCGANRNRGECTCSEVFADERWQGLQGIREQLEKKKNI